MQAPTLWGASVLWDFNSISKAAQSLGDSKGLGLGFLLGVLGFRVLGFRG